MDRIFRSKIDRENNGLKVKILYNREVNKEEEERNRDYFYENAKRNGEEIRRENIHISPSAGEFSSTRTVFSVQLGEELYAGLRMHVYRDASYVFSLLIEDLKKYGNENPDDKKLVNHAVRELEKIAEEEGKNE